MGCPRKSRRSVTGVLGRSTNPTPKIRVRDSNPRFQSEYLVVSEELFTCAPGTTSLRSPEIKVPSVVALAIWATCPRVDRQGIEPRSNRRRSHLGMKHSVVKVMPEDKVGDRNEERTRTPDLRLYGPSLYRLSYPDNLMASEVTVTCAPGILSCLVGSAASRDFAREAGVQPAYGLVRRPLGTLVITSSRGGSNSHSHVGNMSALFRLCYDHMRVPEKKSVKLTF